MPQKKNKKHSANRAYTRIAKVVNRMNGHEFSQKDLKAKLPEALHTSVGSFLRVREKEKRLSRRLKGAWFVYKRVSDCSPTQVPKGALANVVFRILKTSNLSLSRPEILKLAKAKEPLVKHDSIDTILYSWKRDGFVTQTDERFSLAKGIKTRPLVRCICKEKTEQVVLSSQHLN